MMGRCSATALVGFGIVLSLGTSAGAESWYRGPHGKNRVFHLSVSAGLGVLYLASETVLKPSLASETCRWCEPPSLDARVRGALVWNDPDSARMFSNLTGYLAVPIMGVGISALTALSSDDAGWGTVLDHTIPIVETVAISQIITQLAKFSVGRARPFVHFGETPPDTDDNLSFWSGHSALTFGVTTSAGMIAHWNHSEIEPLIWGVGLTLSAATAYLRIAADRHYLTDVVTGSLVGVAAGLTIPRLMRRNATIAIVPIGGGVSVTGAF